MSIFTPAFLIEKDRPRTSYSPKYFRLSLGLLLLLPLLSSISQASIIYDFFGHCAIRCSTVAHGTLVLKDSYVPGTELGGSDYISWKFNSSIGGYNLNDPNNTGENGMWGILPRHIGEANFFLDFGGENTYFETGSWRTDIYAPTTGDWLNTGPEPRNCHITSCDDFNFVYAAGSQHLWVRRIPEPSSLALLLFGLLGIGLLRRTYR